jgi:hypothetical protein
MQIIITETSETKTLDLRDGNGIDWANDLLGNVGALPKYDANAAAYPMTQADYNWWANQIDEIKQADALIEEFAEEFGRIECEFLINRLITLPPTEDGYLAHVKHAIDGYRE